MVDNRQVDVLIIGGGPAGLLVAETTASAGHSTILVEREPEIGNPVRTSGATALETMRYFGIPEMYYHAIPRWRICSANEEAVFNYEEPVGCVIDVRGMYQYLAERAADKGATILTDTRADRPLLDGSFVVGCQVTSKSAIPFEVRSKIAVDASGYRATISKQAGLHQGFDRFGVGSEYDLIAPKCRQDETLLIVGNRYAPSGYAWVFPWGQGRVRVGVGILHADARSDPKKHLTTFLEDAKSFDVDLTGAEVKEYHYGLVPANGVATSLVGDGIIAVGDAAGQASLVVGEGIRLSMVAGQLAGQTAVQSLSRHRFDKDALLPYEHSFRSSFGRNLALGHIVNKRLALYDDDTWDDRVRILKTIPSELLLKLLMSEFPFSEIVPWILAKPYMWPRALRWGLKGLLGYVNPK